MRPSEVTKLSEQVIAYQTQEKRWLSDRNELDQMKTRLADVESERLAAREQIGSLTNKLKAAEKNLEEKELRRKMARRNGGPGPQIIATHALGMLGDASNLLLSCRNDQSPAATRHLQSFAHSSLDLSDTLLNDATNIVGSAGEVEETRRLYVDLGQRIKSLTKAFREQNLVDDKTLAGREGADKVASLTMLICAFKSQLHAIQLRRASAWLSSIRDLQGTEKILKQADDMERMSENMVTAAEEIAPQRALVQVRSIGSQIQQVLEVFRKVSGDTESSLGDITKPPPK
jgi:hypothetical protein